jgi:hypothetical protein
MTNLILNKFTVPIIILLFGIIAGIGIDRRVLTRATPCPKVPDCICKCPNIPTCPTPELQTIDVDKIKRFKGTLNITQHYSVQVQSDSTLLVKAINDAVRNHVKKK